MLRQALLGRALLRYQRYDFVVSTCTSSPVRRARNHRVVPVHAMSFSTLNIQGPGSDKLRAEGCGGACSRDTPKVEPDELQEYMRALPAWRLNADHTMLTRTFTAKNFMAAIRFFNKVAEVAEEEGHHPDLHLRNYREVEINLSTHVVGGLTRPDFALAAKLDALEVEYSPKWAKAEAERLAAEAGGGTGAPADATAQASAL